MTNMEIKQQIVDALFDRPGIWTKRVNATEIRTRCPFCGDTQKNLNDGHFYININTDDNSPVMYHCFLCEEGDILKPSVLALLDIDDPNLKSSVGTLMKTSDKQDKKGLVRGEEFKTFDYSLPEIEIGEKTNYIEKRLGLSDLPMKEFRRMKMITSLRSFLIHNNIKKLTCNNSIAWMLEKYYVGFLTYGNSHILFRDITDTQKISWIKYPITEESSSNRVFYTMDSEIDVFTKDRITINLSEGVLDALSCFYNLGYSDKNTLNLCVSGRYYDRIIMFLVSLGLVGSNVELNIFADNDYMFNNKGKNKKNLYTTSIDFYKNIMKRYKYLFGECSVYYNLKKKDIGYPKSDIILERHIV